MEVNEALLSGRFIFPTDYVLAPFYYFIILIIFWLFAQIVYKDKPYKKYFIWGVQARMIGGIMVALIYQYYYGSGDSTYYFLDTFMIMKAFSTSLSDFFHVMMSTGGDANLNPHAATYIVYMVYARDPYAFFMEKVTSIFSIFGFGYYIPTSILMGAYEFLGVWCLYLTFADIYPKYSKQFAITVLFIPSTVFWGSGIWKDAVTIASIGWVTYGFYQVFLKKNGKIIIGILCICWGFYLCYNIKPYIILSLLPCLVMWVILTYRKRIYNQLLRIISGPIFFVIAIALAVLMIQKVGQSAQKYSVNNFFKSAQTMQQWHGYLDSHNLGSGYTLPDYNGSIASLIKIIPYAINVTLFRPYLWEARSPTLFLSALQCMIMLLMTIFILFTGGVRFFFSEIFKNPFLFLCISFSLLFAFAVGFSSYNFGALDRYRIPCLPFYTTALVILYYKVIEFRAERKAKRLVRVAARKLE
jgi:hypothetical protein